jgi:hypothetical protein
VGSPLFGDGVENFASDRNRKDINLAAYVRPEWVEGLQIGGSFLNGDLIPSNGARPVNQIVTSLYAVLIDSKWEFLNEFVWLHQRVTGGGRAYDDLTVQGDEVTLRLRRSSTPMQKKEGIWVFSTGKPMASDETAEALRQVRARRDRHDDQRQP